MKLYDWAAAPNPKRVRMFLAEKGLKINTVQVAGEDFQLGPSRVFTLGAGDPLLGPLAGHARGAALALLDAFPPARQFVGRRMMFGARGW